MDKYKELSRQLQYCGDEGKCQSCEFYRETEPCSQNLLDAAADAIEELLNVKWHESCTDCPLYDKEKHRCPRFNAVIPMTIEDALAELPSAQPEPEHTMEEFMYCQDLGSPEDGSL